jgi:hypothetical protein
MRRLLLGLLVLTTALGAAGGSAAAQGSGDSVAREASRHFQRGVDLYGEGDFRGALVEFRKAHRLLPRASVLFNIGQTEYQLQEYAQALRTLERFLAETGPNSAHRAEVQETVETLRTRVGWIALTSDRPDCDVTVDDQPAGTTPLSRSLLVSVGRRRLALACPGRPRNTREVDVASGETVRVAFKADPLLVAAAPAAAPAAPEAHAASPGRSRLAVVTSLTITGLLTAGTLGFYGAAIGGSRQLERLRASYPVSAERLQQKAASNRRLALVGDVLAVGAVAAAGLTTYLSLSSRGERNVAVALTLDGLAFKGQF